MLLLNLISSLSFVCENDVYYVNDQESLNMLSNCSTIDGNLVINSGYEIDNFIPLFHLKNITGNLVIIDNHQIRNLYGLNNLEYVGGNDLYLDRYSVVIKFNLNNYNDIHEGLCYPDHIDWTLITDSNYDIRQNGVNCPDCHIECVGCWGPGPTLCQLCRNYKYFNTCVSRCPGESDGIICDQILPSPPILNYTLENLNNVNLFWDKSNENDFISGYKIYLNDELNYTNISSQLGYYEDNIKYNYSFIGLEYDEEYNFSVKFLNDLGESNMSNTLNLVMGQPSTTVTTTLSTTPTTTLSTTATTTLAVNMLDNNADDSIPIAVIVLLSIFGPLFLVALMIVLFYKGKECIHHSTKTRVAPSNNRGLNNALYESNNTYNRLNIKNNLPPMRTTYNNLQRNSSNYSEVDDSMITRSMNPRRIVTNETYHTIRSNLK